MSDEATPTGTSIAATVMVPVPERGRRFTAERPVRWGDTDRHGRLRLDALARFLQDVANDDTRDAGFDPFAPWVVRRTTVVTRLKSQPSTWAQTCWTSVGCCVEECTTMSPSSPGTTSATWPSR